MRFDVARALGDFQELGGARFAGPDGESRTADFVAEQFARTGLEVERREVVGSRFPQRAGPWVGWIGYGALLTGAYLLLWWSGVLTSMLAFLLIYLSFQWLNAVLGDRIHLGARQPPLETVPVVIAARPGAGPAPVRVIFQAILGGEKSDLFPLRRYGYWVYFFLRNVGGVVFVVLLGHQLLSWFGLSGARSVVAYRNLMRYGFPGLLAIVWLGVAGLLCREHARTRRIDDLHRADRRGLAVLLEMARTWPATGVRPIEAVFVAAGGQRLDRAGSREIVRLRASRWSDKPSLLLLFFAPGAGEKLDLTTFDPLDSEFHELAQSAARNLWAPIQDDSPLLLTFTPWPFTKSQPAVALAGSRSSAFHDSSVDPQALHHAAQLATEIALRWAKRQQRLADSPA